MNSRALGAAAFALLQLYSHPCAAIDSYRYLHVSIETPWMIFLFLLIAVFAPFVLMVVLMWRRQLEKSSAARESKDADDE